MKNKQIYIHIYTQYIYEFQLPLQAAYHYSRCVLLYCFLLLKVFTTSVVLPYIHCTLTHSEGVTALYVIGGELYQQQNVSKGS